MTAFISLFPFFAENNVSTATEWDGVLRRDSIFKYGYGKPREVWVENFDTVKEEKRGIVELNPKVFATVPRLDVIHDNVRWQCLHRRVVCFCCD